MNPGTLEILRQAEAERERERQREGWTEDSALGDQELWEPKRVLAAMLDAHRMLSVVERRVGPARLKSGHPDYQRVKREGDYPNEDRRPEPEYATRINFDRMEQILFGWKDAEGIVYPSWQVIVLDDAPKVHDKFEAWIKARLHRQAISAMCKRRRWALRTVEWHRDKAAGIIAVRLNRARIPVW